MTAPATPSHSHPRNGKADGPTVAFPEGSGRVGNVAGPLGESLRHFLERTKDLPPLSWLIPEVLPSVGQAWVIAKPGAGKTWLSFIIAKTAAADERDVFVVEEEHSARGLRDRFAGVAFPNDALDRVRVWHRLGLKVGGNNFEALVREVERADRPVVIFDCLAQVLIGKENEADTAAVFNDCLKRLVIANPLALLVVLHHTSKGSERAEDSVAYAGRGSSAFNGGADVELRLRPLPSEKGSGILRFTLETTKAREFEAGSPRQVTLRLGTGEVTIDAVAKVLVDRAALVLEALREAQGPLSKDAVSKQMKKRRDDVGKLIDVLERQGKVRKEGKGYVVADPETAGTTP